MDTPEKAQKFPLVTVIVVVIVILASMQWYQTRPASKVQDLTVSVSDAEQVATENINTLENYGTTTDSGTNTTVQTISNQAAKTDITNNITKNNMHTVTIETNKGTIVFETYDADAPKTAQNFITLAQKGFYENVVFHRVIEGFMIQGGDPTGTGSGGPGYKFADELDPNTASYKAGYVRGTVAMANAGPNTNGSQFFIMHKDTPLPNSYTIFGKVVKGMEVVDAIATTPVGPGDRPVSEVVMKKVTVASK